MTEQYSEHVTAVRQLALSIDRISQVSVPELTVSDEMIVEEKNGEDWYELEEDEDWWEAWCEIHRIVEETLGSAKVSESNIRPEIPREQQYDKITAKTDWTALSVKVYADGGVKMLAEYDRGDSRSWDVLYEGWTSNEIPNLFDLGREVASAELAALASETESCADTLDYWQTTIAPNSFKQHRWARIRGVGRQTVNDRVRSASAALIREYGPNELHDALNNVDPGDVLDFAFIKNSPENVTGGGVFRVSEVIAPFGDGNGEIECENDVDDVVTTIREIEREDDERVGIERDGELTHIGGHVTVK